MNRTHLLCVLFPAALLTLTGCLPTPPSPEAGTNPSASLASAVGMVHGGQQPIANAVIQIYQAGTSGYGTGATALITGTTVTTDSNGNFSVTGDYTCTPGSMVYITATGGQPTIGITNSSINLIAGLGNCSSLSSSTFITVDEVTTVGTVWALAPFMNGVNIGAPSTNQNGLVNAFADINTLVNTTNGTTQNSTVTVAVPSAEINTLANILAGCINSNGSSGFTCSTLFSDTPNADSSFPADTLSAAINIARNPARNVTALLNLQRPASPFEPALATLTDFTVAVTYTGQGINAPKAVAIDASNNVWIANAGSVTEISHVGIAVGSSPFTGSGISTPSAIAIDTGGNAWIANSNSTITEISPSGTNVSSSTFGGGGLRNPSAIAFDASGNVWLTNAGSSAVSEFSPSGFALSGTNGFAAANGSLGIAITPQ